MPKRQEYEYCLTVIYKIKGTNDWKERTHTVKGENARAARLNLFYEYVEAECKVRSVYVPGVG